MHLSNGLFVGFYFLMHIFYGDLEDVWPTLSWRVELCMLPLTDATLLPPLSLSHGILLLFFFITYLNCF